MTDNLDWSNTSAEIQQVARTLDISMNGASGSTRMLFVVVAVPFIGSSNRTAAMRYVSNAKPRPLARMLRDCLDAVERGDGWIGGKR